MAATFACKICRKHRRRLPNQVPTNTCIRCVLFSNKVVLIRCFHAIVDQPEMKEFKSSMEQWYV